MRRRVSNPGPRSWRLVSIRACWLIRRHANDYPKMAMWNNPQPGGAYHFTVQLVGQFTPTLHRGESSGARSRPRCLLAGPPTPSRLQIPLAGVGDSYSLVPASFRTGNPPPADRDEMLLAIDSPSFRWRNLDPGPCLVVSCRFCHPWKFHLGVGADHSPNALITVDPFVDAFTS